MGDIEDGQSIDYDEFESEAPEPNHLGDDPMSETILSKMINEGKSNYHFYVCKRDSTRIAAKHGVRQVEH